jgi:hypothetical protein
MRGDDIIDSRDIIARFKELDSDRDDLLGENEEDSDEGIEALKDWDEADEYSALKGLIDEAEGYGDWRHGETLINDDYFKRYAQELAEDLGLMENCDKWPATCIDWEKAADELKQDYTSVEFDGQTYWMRS